METTRLRADTLAESLRMVAGPAREAGLSLTETVGILAVLAEKGYAGRRMASEMNKVLEDMSKAENITRLEELKEAAQGFIKVLESSGGAMMEKAAKDPDIVAESWKRMVNEMSEDAQKLYDTWKKPLTEVLNDIREVFKVIGEEIEKNKPELQRFAKWVGELAKDTAAEAIKYIRSIAPFIDTIANAGTTIRSAIRDKLPITNAIDRAAAGIGPGGQSVTYNRDPLDSYGTNLIRSADYGITGIEPNYSSAGEISVPAPAAVKKKAEAVKVVAEDLGDFVNETTSDVFDEMRDKAAKAGEAMWRNAQEKKIALDHMWNEMGKSFGADFLDVIAQKLAGFEVSWSSMWQNMKYQMIKTFMATGQLDIGGMLGGAFGGGGSGGSGGIFGGLLGGATKGGGIFGGATSSIMSWAGPLALGYGVLKSAFKADTRVEVDQRQQAADYQAQIDAGKEQLAAMLQEINMGELNADGALRDAIAGFQFVNPEQGMNEFGSGGGLSRHTVQQFFIKNEEAVKAQMARFQELMSRVQGTKQFEQAARENTFTGAGYMTVNNFSNIVQGNQVVNDAAMNDLARDFGRRMIKLGLVAAGTV
jgi:hypothetical protein